MSAGHILPEPSVGPVVQLILSLLSFSLLRTFWARPSVLLEKSSAPQGDGWRGPYRKSLNILTSYQFVIDTTSVVLIKLMCFFLFVEVFMIEIAHKKIAK